MMLTEACRVPSLNLRKQFPPRLPLVTVTVCAAPKISVGGLREGSGVRGAAAEIVLDQERVGPCGETGSWPEGEIVGIHVLRHLCRVEIRDEFRVGGRSRKAEGKAREHREGDRWAERYRDVERRESARSKR